MSADILPFQKPPPRKRKIRVPSGSELVRKIHRMLRFNRMLMPHPETKNLLLAKGITPMQMMSTIKQGKPIGEPVLNEDGDWQLTLKRLAAGRKTQVTMAVKADNFIIVNVN